jgi:undecaprenyl pyrophosphate synthase
MRGSGFKKRANMRKGDSQVSMEKFMKLSDRKVSEMVMAAGKPKTVLIVPDGTRRVCMTDYGLNPLDEDFLKNHFSIEQEKAVKIIQTIFDHGIQTLFFPGVTHGNLSRSSAYLDGLVNIGIKYMLTDEMWLDFYDDYEIRVKVYGDLEYIAGLGYPIVKKWAKEIESRTRQNDGHTLFHGFAVSQSLEEMRLTRMAVDFYTKYKRYPSREDLQKMYFGDILDAVDIFIRTVEVRDSQCQPVLIGGAAEMYFPVTPFIYLDRGLFRLILYDYIYCRMRTYSKKSYATGVDTNEIDTMRKYYSMNKDIVLGLGKRKKNGKFWFATTNMDLPGSMNEW